MNEQNKTKKLTSNSRSDILYEVISCSTKLSNLEPSPANAIDAPFTAEPCWAIKSLLLDSSALYFDCIPINSCLQKKRKNNVNSTSS